MTPERCKELLPVMQAFAEGKEIEARVRGVSVISQKETPWMRSRMPSWDDSFEYRIKPQPVKTMGYRRFIVKYSHKYYRVGVVLEDQPNLVEYTEKHLLEFIRWIDTEWQYETVTP